MNKVSRLKRTYSLIVSTLFIILTPVSLLAEPSDVYQNPCYTDSSKKGFTYEKIVETIQNKNIRTIEALLPQLPECFRSNYTLVHDSQSLQKSTPLNPRAILFNQDAKLSCTFNGDPSLPGFDSLECYQYRDKERKFEFFEIEFPSKRNNLKNVEFSLPNMRVNKQISCTSCHSKDPRPNWEDYPMWAGVYGKDDDVLQDLNNPGDDKNDTSFKEKENFLLFKIRAASSDRYRHLINPVETKYAPYRAAGNLDKELGLLLRPNSKFTILLGPLMAKRNSRILESFPRWVSYLFLRRLVNCRASEDEKAVVPQFVFPEAPVFKYDLIFKGLIDVYTWTPFFRNLSQSCSVCRYEKITPPDHLYAYNGGLGDFNQSVAFHVVDHLIKTGDADLAPFYGTTKTHQYYGGGINSEGVLSAANTIDTRKLGNACVILERKFKDSYVK